MIAENLNPQAWCSEHPLQANEPHYLIISNAESSEALMYRLFTTTLLAALLCLSGCAGNYKSSDDDYRPLGDPHAEQRDN